MIEHLVIVDPAKKRDYYASLVLRYTPVIIPANDALGIPARSIVYFDGIHIDLAQGLSYIEAADRTAALMRHHKLNNTSRLVVDATGVGEAMVDLFRERKLDPVPIVFTGGGTVREVYKMRSKEGAFEPLKRLQSINVPKAHMVQALALLLQQGRIRLDSRHPNADIFKRQLAAFRGILRDETQRRKYENEADSIHDDLVCCAMMGAWYAQYVAPEVKEKKILPEAVNKPWEPYDYY